MLTRLTLSPAVIMDKLTRFWRKSSRTPQADALTGAAVLPVTKPEPSSQIVFDDWQFNQPVLMKRSGRASSWLVWTLGGGVVTALIWAAVAPLEETVAIKGKLEPSSAVRVVQSPVPGIVEQVLVKDNQAVRAGQPLLRFDLREVRSRLQASLMQQQLLENENRISRAQLGEVPATGLSPNQQAQLRSQQEEWQTRIQSSQLEVTQLQEQLSKSQQRQKGLEQSLDLNTGILNTFETLARQGAAAQLQALQQQDRVQQLRSDLEQEQKESLRLQAQIAQANARSRNTEAITGAELRAKIEANLRTLADLSTQIATARLQLQYGELRAPINGIIFATEPRPGTVVSAGSSLLKIVPQDNLIARVYAPNSAIGFLKPGQSVTIALDTFPANEYGRLSGRLTEIGSDALSPSEVQQKLGAPVGGSEDFLFPSKIRLDQQYLQVGKKRIPLQSGLTLTADVKLRERRFIDLFTGFFSDKRDSLKQIR